MALDRIPLGLNNSISFWKLLGCGKGETFTPRDADPYRWGLLLRIEEDELAKFESSPLMQRWNNRATNSFAATLKTISSHGDWSRKKPFPIEIDGAKWSGPVVAITRARIKPRKNLIFWRSVPPVTAALKRAPGLLSAIGIGEAPIGLQGTFSIWKDGESIREFAYRGVAHRAAIDATERERWYAEELFARFALIDANGRL
jgi:hypothetical protein